MTFAILFICVQYDYVRTTLSKVNDVYNFIKLRILENRIKIQLSQSILR